MSHRQYFKVGERVVLTPTGVLEIAGIGPLRNFVSPERRSYVVTVAGALAGGSLLEEERRLDEEHYALRYVGSTEVAHTFPTNRSDERGPRAILSAADAEKLLESVANASPRTFANVGEAVDAMRPFLGRNDPEALLQLYCIMLDPTSAPPGIFCSLRDHLIEEIALATGASQDAVAARIADRR